MKILFQILLLIILSVSCSGSKHENYSAKIEPESITAIPGTESFIAVKIEIPGNGYIYANPKGPGIGKAVTVTASSADPFIFLDTKYPSGKKHTASGETKHVFIYANETYIFVPFITKDKTANGLYPVSIKVDSLLCDASTCTPKIDNITTRIEVDSSKKAFIHNQEIQALFNETPASDIKNVSNDTASNPVEDNKKGSISEIDFTPRFLENGITGILQAVIFGIIAGFILNFMPCVLPVVSLKIMGFVENAGKDKKEIAKLGIIFSSGIILSFTMLAVLAAFFGYNWGGLFQHRMFILVMSAIVFTLAMSMFHVFTLNIPSFAGKAVSSSAGNPYLDTFVKGLFATLLATPCSGPFLGGTLAWTISQPAYIIFIVFISIGFGMALPYLVISFKPGLVRFIPKPGTWMTTFENVMAFLLIFTVIYLIGILDNDSRMPAIFFLAFIAAGLFQYGQFGSLINSPKSRFISAVSLIVIVLAGYFISFNYIYSADEKLDFASIEYTEERLLANKQNGIITVIKFTADWCPNCRLVEAGSLKTQRVYEIFKKEKIDFLTADITRKNPPAELILKKFGSNSIPVLAVIPPGEQFKSPICLRDIYSEEDVLKAVQIAIEERNKQTGTK